MAKQHYTVRATVSKYENVQISEHDLLGLLNEVELSPAQLVDLLRKSVAKSLTKSPDAEIKDGQWVEDVEHHGSHSWYSTEEIRKAKKVERKLMADIDAVQHSLLQLKLTGDSEDDEDEE
jgi:hypothetical protein